MRGLTKEETHPVPSRCLSQDSINRLPFARSFALVHPMFTQSKVSNLLRQLKKRIRERLKRSLVPIAFAVRIGLVAQTNSPNWIGDTFVLALEGASLGCMKREICPLPSNLSSRSNTNLQPEFEDFWDALYIKSLHYLLNSQFLFSSIQGIPNVFITLPESVWDHQILDKEGGLPRSLRIDCLYSFSKGCIVIKESSSPLFQNFFTADLVPILPLHLN